MNLGLPKFNIAITDRPPALDWYKFFTRLVAAVETSNSLVTSNTVVKKIGTVYVDATAGDVDITPQAFPLVIQKVDASANAVNITGITVNGNPTYSFNTQYQAVTIDTVDGVFYAR